MPDLNKERWLAAKDRDLSAREAEVIEAMVPVVAASTGAIEELVAGLPEDSPSREVAWPPVQAKLKAILPPERQDGRGWIRHWSCRSYRPGSLLRSGWTERWINLSAAELLQAVLVGGDTLAEWFRRRSPSRWMEGLIDAVSNAVAAGWSRDAAARDLAGRVWWQPPLPGLRCGLRHRGKRGRYGIRTRGKSSGCGPPGGMMRSTWSVRRWMGRRWPPGRSCRIARPTSPAGVQCLGWGESCFWNQFRIKGQVLDVYAMKSWTRSQQGLANTRQVAWLRTIYSCSLGN